MASKRKHDESGSSARSSPPTGTHLYEVFKTINPSDNQTNNPTNLVHVDTFPNATLANECAREALLAAWDYGGHEPLPSLTREGFEDWEETVDADGLVRIDATIPEIGRNEEQEARVTVVKVGVEDRPLKGSAMLWVVEDGRGGVKSLHQSMLGAKKALNANIDGLKGVEVVEVEVEEGRYMTLRALQDGSVIFKVNKKALWT